jgi:DNA (cytosine-5)-methyltransferase 1
VFNFILQFTIETLNQVLNIQQMLRVMKEIYDNNIQFKLLNSDEDLKIEVNTVTVIDYLIKILGSDKYGYAFDQGILSAVDFGAPQKRQRFFLWELKNRFVKKYNYLSLFLIRNIIEQ